MVRFTTATCFIVLALSSLSSFGEEMPTCRWLHLDQDTRVYQCAVLPPIIETEVGYVADSLPDPTQPLAEQQLSQSEAVYSGIPEFLMESVRAPKKPITPKLLVANEVVTPTITAAITVIAIAQPDVAKSKMQLLGDDHFYLLPKSQRLSVGVYSTERYAKLRQKTLGLKGIETELVMRDTGQSIAFADNTPSVDSIQSVKIESEVLVEVMPKVLPELLSEVLPEVLTEELPEVLPKGQREAIVEVDVAAVEPAVKKVALKAPRNRTVSGYLVAAIGDQADTIHRLQKINATDYVALKVDPYRGRVSLGVYSSYANAEARQDHFKRLGIDSELISRNNSIVVRSTVTSGEAKKTENAPYGFDQIALRPLEM